VDAICDDVTAEQEDLDRIVSAPDVLERPTPAPGWTVGDQISHLWFFDQRALMALTDPDAFAADAEQMLAALERGTDPSVLQGRAVSGEQLLSSWRRDRATLVDRARAVDPKSRVPWYGPAMGARSFLTARLMETWAHGQDIADALGIERPATERLRHVAHIGVGARPFSYVANGRSMPEEPVRVELTAPSGDTWTWGADDVADRVTGPALDFCLLATQRRHRADLDVRAEGPGADEWLDIAQAFAGPPGAGRRAGQFAR